MLLPELCSQIQELYRQRCVNLKSRIMLENRLVASVATSDGYYAGMDEKERKKRFDAARGVIESVRGESSVEIESCDAHPLRGLILAASTGIDGFDDQVGRYEKELEKVAKQLPVYKWTCLPEQRGFGTLSLAKIVGEAGNLDNYENPGKLWRRMGCAPFESRGRMLMPSTWRFQKPGLSAEEWEECGYNPRRRSTMYVIGEGLLKQNKGPYRKRYDEAKQRSRTTHPEWWVCSKCDGTGKAATGKTCSNCKGSGEVALHGHRHGMLLASKLLLKLLWCEWTGADPSFVPKGYAAVLV